jgi:hypothetical protein
MTYDQLVDFVQNRMRMSHVYQPVMLAVLLAHGGKCSTEEIARAILAHDESQVEYYENVTENMVGRVLKGHGIVEREDDGYSLVLLGAYATCSAARGRIGDGSAVKGQPVPWRN